MTTSKWGLFIAYDYIKKNPRSKVNAGLLTDYLRKYPQTDICLSAENYLDLVSLAVACNGDDAAGDLSAVNGKLLDALVDEIEKMECK